MQSIKKRQLPGPIPLSEFIDTIKEFEEFIGLDWLSAQKADASPLLQVWHRMDHLASLELFTVADSYKQLASRTDTGWLDKYKEAIRSHNAKDIRSQTYELVSSAMFSYEHCVELCPPSHPGYDFTVSGSGKTLHVSCKKLGISDGEKDFLKQAHQLYEHVRATAAKLRTPSFQGVLELVNRKNRLKLTLLELQSGITYQLATYNGNSIVSHNIGGWRLTLAPLYYGPDNLLVDREYASHQFTCIAPHSQDEQRRFVDRFSAAARKLKKHGQSINDDNVNMIMIGLPPAVSFGTAKEWLNDKFLREHSSVSAVLLTRSIVASTKNMASTSFQYEVSLITNQSSQVNWYKFVPRGFMYKLKVAIGGITEQESYNALELGGTLIKLKDKYHFQAGQLNLEAGPRGKEMRINPLEGAGVQYTIINRIPEQGAFGISAITPPDNTLLLL
jgi:hypothetical protein